MAAIATITTFYPMDGKEGVNLNMTVANVTATANTPEYPAPPMKLGDRVQGNAGSEWMFVQASTTVTCYNLVAIDSGYNANPASIAMAASNAYTWGVAEFPPNQNGAVVSIGNANGGVCNAGDFFWALMKSNGGAQINALTTALTCANRVFINIGTPGCITTTASDKYFPGLIIPTSLMTTTVVTPILAAWNYLISVSVTA